MKTFDEAVNFVIKPNRVSNFNIANKNGENLLIQYPYMREICENEEITDMLCSTAFRCIKFAFTAPQDIYTIIRTIFFLGLITGIEMEKKE